jgi:hypothetical protein
MQDAELLANYPPDNEQRFHQHSQIEKVLDKLPNTRLELRRPTMPTLRPKLCKVARRSFSIVRHENRRN